MSLLYALPSRLFLEYDWSFILQGRWMLRNFHKYPIHSPEFKMHTYEMVSHTSPKLSSLPSLGEK